MASATNFSASSASTSQLNPSSPETIQAQFDAGISLTLALWPALSLAVANNWGGPSSADKRDWFAGAVSDLFVERPDTDLEDVETVLLQVMLDEFEVNVDDESAFDIAESIMRLKTQCDKGDFAEVDALREKWGKKSSKGDAALFQKVERNEEDDETDGSSMSDESEDEDGDVEMGEAPTPREKPAPEIDDDGFQKVVGKKRK